MKLRAAALAGALLVGAAAWPALGHSGNDNRPGAAQFDLEVKLNGEVEPAFAPKVVADRFGNLYAVARKQLPAGPDTRAETAARASSWRWTSTDGGATWTSLPGAADAAVHGTATDVAVDAKGRVYIYDAPVLLRWNATGLGKVAFAGAAPVPGALPTEEEPVLVAHGDGQVVLLAGTTVFVSRDAGQTFSLGYALPGATECRIAARGKAVYATCLDGAGTVHLHVSHDSGATFTRRDLATYDPGAPFVDVPPIAVTPDGTVHVLRSETPVELTVLYLMSSKDGGRTWTTRFASDEADKYRMTRLSLTASPDGRLGAAMYVSPGIGFHWFVAGSIFRPDAKVLVVSFADHTIVADKDGPPPPGSPGVGFLPDSRLTVTWTIVNEYVPDSTTPLLLDAWFVRSQRPDAKSDVPDLARTPRFEIPPCTVAGQVTRVADWQSIRAPSFRARAGGAGESLAAYAVDAYDPRIVFATNGTTVMRSDDGGCRWREVWSLEPSPSEAMPSSAATGRIVALAVPEDRREHETVLAVLSDGSGEAARSYVVRSETGEPGSFALASGGLPPAGAPGLFRVAGANPDFLYFTIGNHLWASEDAGASWQLRTAATELATTPRITALTLDPLSPVNLYAVRSGVVVHSRDGGRTWVAPAPSAALHAAAGPITAIDVFHAVGEAPRPMAWSEPAGSKTASVLSSPDDGVTWTRTSAPGLAGPVESAVHGSRADVLVVSTLPVNDGKATVAVRDRRTGTYVDLSPVATSAPFRVSADRRGHPTFYGMSPGALYRYAGDDIEPPPAPDAIDDSVFGDLGPERHAPVVTPRRSEVSLLVGESATVPFRIDLAPRKQRVDVFVLVDTSESMVDTLPVFRRELIASLGRLAKDVDLWVGVSQAKTDSAPPIYRRERDVGPFGAPVASALDRLVGSGPPYETQLIGLDQIVTGAGMDPCATVGLSGRGGEACLDPPVGSVCEIQPDAAGCAVRPGQQANWRDDSVRVVVHATDTTFRNPAGTPRQADGTIDIPGVARKYQKAHVLHLGVAVHPEGIEDLARMSALTETVAPAGGLDCGGGVRIAAGRPAVCPSAAGLDGVLRDLAVAHAHGTHVHVERVGKAPAVLEHVTPHEYDHLNLALPHRLSARAEVSCVGVAPGTYDVRLQAMVHDEAPVPFGVTVECVLPPVSAPRPPRVVTLVPPLLPPVAPAAPAPPNVNVNPNVQTQVQAQVQVQAGAATQEDQQVELAMAEVERETGVPAELVVLAGAMGASAAAFAAQRATSTSPVRAR